MTAENFCYFLQGYLETSNPGLIGPTQTSLIREKLNETIIDKPTYISGQNFLWNWQTNSSNDPSITGDSRYWFNGFAKSDYISGQFGWYPESLRQYNLKNPTRPISC